VGRHVVALLFLAASYCASSQDRALGLTGAGSLMYLGSRGCNAVAHRCAACLLAHSMLPSLQSHLGWKQERRKFEH
jgi:hypothetical protein